jgi:hypothetical protein
MEAATATDQIKNLFKEGTAMAQQPLTSPIGMGRFTRVPSDPDPDKDLNKYFKNRLAIVQGTMGVDWSIAPFEEGSVYVIPVAPEHGTRVATPVDTTTTDASKQPLLVGVLDPRAVWRIPLQVGERVFGMPRIVNNEIIFNTAFGSFSGDITASLTEAGNLYQVGTTSSGALRKSVESNQSKSFAGVVVFGDKLVITTDNSIGVKDLPAELKPDGDPSTRPFNRFTPAIFRTWETGERTE